MTSPAPIPDGTKRFLLEYIDSVPALEALLLMRRTPDREWTPSTLAAELYLQPRQVEPILSDLAARGLCRTREAGEVRYSALAPATDLAVRLDELADVYAKHLVAVTNLIHTKPRASVRMFSDAFRLRRTE